MGDSLTQGYGLPPEDGFVPQLQAWLAANGSEVEVVNAGVSGDTTAGGRERVDWALEPGTGALILELGANDMLRGLDPDEAKANLSAILAKAGERGLPVLLIGIAAPGNYGEGYRSGFDGLWPELSKTYGTVLIPDFLAPVREAFGAGTPMDELVQGDGLHPTAKGVGLIVEMVGPRVLELAAIAGKG